MSIAETLKTNARLFPEKTAIEFIDTEEGHYDYFHLNEAIKKRAACLQALGAKGKPVALMLPLGPEYVLSLFACFYMGAIAIPLYPVKKRHAQTVSHILSNAAPHCILTNQAFTESYPCFSPAKLLTLSNKPYKDDTPSPQSIALLQYTSGSTSAPKGVMVTHQNIIANLMALSEKINTPHPRVLSWLPFYHDMGLIGGLCFPLYAKGSLAYLSPNAFTLNPFSWLTQLSKRHITTAPAASFALDLCVDKASPELIQTLDLSALKHLILGAEPIHADAVKRFVKTFQSVGLSSHAICPAYGMAEGTLMLSMKNDGLPWQAIALDKKAYLKGEVRPASSQASSFLLTSCGTSAHNHQIRIVNPETKQSLEPGQIGEIWAAGPSITQGYWNSETHSASNFNQALANKKQSDYLRTGDLGFIQDGELYVTGRRKELIIIRGENFYPQDIEQAIAQACDEFEPKSSSAFEITEQNTQQLVLIQEVKRGANYEALLRLIKKTLLSKFRLTPWAVVLIKPNSLPKTSSGKLKRLALKTAFLNEASLKGELIRWQKNDNKSHSSMVLPSLQRSWGEGLGVRGIKNPLIPSPSPASGRREQRGGGGEPGAKSHVHAGLENWFSSWCEQQFGFQFAEEDMTLSLTELGLSSMIFSSLAHDFETQFKCPLPLSTALAQQSLQTLIDHIKAAHEGFIALPEKPTPDEALKSIFFEPHEGIAGAQTKIKDKTYINYASYNYLDLSGHPSVKKAAIQAIQTYGTSVSASRLVAGEKPIHAQLEQAIAKLIDVPSALIFSSGYGTNLAILDTLFSKGDLILYDAYAHNSLIKGATYCGADCIAFPHNRPAFIAQFLEKHRERYKQVLLITEGIFSMDGDIPDIPALIALKKRFNTQLMIDEAHSIGVLGKTGAGIREHFALQADEVDIWMGTLSKSFASCGGYVAGSHHLIERLKYEAEGFIFSAGISPANTAAALASIQIMEKEPCRLTQLKKCHERLLSLFQAYGLPTGLSQGTPIIPLIVGDDNCAVQLSQSLKQKGIIAMPIVYPAVPSAEARLRFFISSAHREENLDYTAKQLKLAFEKLKPKASQAIAALQLE